LIVRTADFDWPFSVAVTVAVAVDARPVVVIVNVVEPAPAGTVTDDGTVALALLIESVTLTPPVPAGPVSVTVPTVVAPPPTTTGSSVKEDRPGGVIVSEADMELPVVPPLIATVVSVLTDVVLTVNVAFVCPAPTATHEGTEAAELLDVRGSIIPPIGAACAIVTVPIADDPPSTELGLTNRAVNQFP